MKFDVIVGNPPYQLSSGETSDSPIYQLFVQQAFSLEPSFVCMVTPSRWFTGGKGLDEFRNQMISDKQIRTIVDFPDSKDSFPGVEIKGGVSYFLWAKGNQGKCRFVTINKGLVISEAERELSDGRGVVVRDNFASSIIEKVMALDEKRLSDKVSTQTPFGLYTNFDRWTKTQEANSVRLYKRGLETSWVDKSLVTSHAEWIPQIKVLMSYAYNGGDAIPHQIIGRPFVVEGNSVCTQTYMVAGLFDNEEEATNYANYLCTKVVRFLIRQRKISQHNRPETFAFIPDLPMAEFWDDEKICARYGINEEEFEYIQSQIKDLTPGEALVSEDE